MADVTEDDLERMRDPLTDAEVIRDKAQRLALDVLGEDSLEYCGEFHWLVEGITKMLQAAEVTMKRERRRAAQRRRAAEPSNGNND